MSDTIFECDMMTNHFLHSEITIFCGKSSFCDVNYDNIVACVCHGDYKMGFGLITGFIEF
jgi:hypothetical protein